MPRDFTKIKTPEDIAEALTGARIKSAGVVNGGALRLDLESAVGESFRLTLSAVPSLREVCVGASISVTANAALVGQFENGRSAG